MDATFQPFGRNCSEGGQQEATGGTVTYTTVSDTLVAGSYDLLFGRSRVQGSFTAPMCMVCAPRPGPRLRTPIELAPAVNVALQGDRTLDSIVPPTVAFARNTAARAAKPPTTPFTRSGPRPPDPAGRATRAGPASGR